MRWFRSTGLRLLLATGLSFALWIFVSFSENPDQSASFEGVPVAVEGLPPQLVLVDTNGLPKSSLPPVDITVQADAQTLANNVQSDSIHAYVDLGTITPGDHIVPIIANAERSDLQGLTFSSIDPSNISIRVEELITTTVPITVEVQGNLPFSFERGVPQVTDLGRPITQTLVSGPQGRVSQVATVRVVADIEQLRADYTSLVTLQPLDESDSLVEGVTVVPSQVSVRIPIRSVAGLRRVAVLGQVTGFPAPGYIVSTITSDPQLVNLTGSSGPLDAVNEIETEPIDITGLTRTISREVSLLLPVGTSLQVGQPSRATVTIRIEPLTRPFSIELPVPVQITNIPNGVLATLGEPTIDVTLAGTEAVLAQLGSTPLQATVDLSGLGAGTHEVAPSVALPDGVQIVGALPNVSVTLRAVPTATVLPTPTDEAAPEPEPQSTTQTAPTATPPPDTLPPTDTPPPMPTATPSNPTVQPSDGAGGTAPVPSPTPTQESSNTAFPPPEISPTADSTSVIQ